MSNDSLDWSWSVLLNWLMNQIAFNDSRILRSELPPVESKDGQEPTVESLREEARQADALAKSHPPKELPARSTKSLDKEFWETM